MNGLFPEIESFNKGHLQVDTEHSIYWEESGNPKGFPIIFIHGGPGGGTEPKHRRFFDPNFYRIILFDQRGSGKSTPHASLNNNTTWHLVDDMEKIRKLLKIEKWVLFGGSWGSTLALAYAIKNASKVTAMILRGIFLCRHSDLDWFYRVGGVSNIFPEEWDKFYSHVSGAKEGNLIEPYYKLLTSSDPDVRRKAAKAWSSYEAATIKLQFDPQLLEQFTQDDQADAIARIECHYFINKGFFESDNWLLDNIKAIEKIPGIIVHGRYDIPCPAEGAWSLHKAWSNSTLEIVPASGHSASEPGICDALIRASQSIKQHHVFWGG